MENNDVKAKESIRLEKAFTYFIIPFYYEGNDYAVLKVDDNPLEAMWEKSKGKILNEEDDVLYPYIINFLQGQSNDHLDIYSINSTPKSSARKFWDAFSQKPAAVDKRKKDKTQTKTDKETSKSLHSADLEIKNEKGEKLILPTAFDLQRDSGYTGLKSPHLFISPSANIGILFFCIGLGEDDKTIDNLKRFNYYLHKVSKPLNKCTTSSFQLNKQIFPNEQARLSKENRIVGFRKMIAPHGSVKQLCTPYCEFNWNIRALIDMLLSDVKGLKQEDGKKIECGVHLFSNTRAHLFTFCQIDGIQTSYEYDDIKKDLMCLSRCVNDRYMLPIDDSVEKSMCLKTFNNIYFASSVEGAAMIAISKKENEEYIKQIDNQGLPRYLSIYILVLIQRYSMLHINRRLTELSSDTASASLWNILDIIKRVKVHCFYTDVSPYTQHNQFYQHCNKNLHIYETFNEIDNKTKILNLTISHDTQELLEQQKKVFESQREEENRREKVQLKLDKQRDDALREAERKAESGQRRLNLVVGILTVFQVAGVIFEFCKGWEFLRFTATSITFVVGFFLLYIVMNWEKENKTLIRWVRSIYYWKNNSK